jgi:D-alanyl-D-alanine carboxypeptidase
MKKIVSLSLFFLSLTVTNVAAQSKFNSAKLDSLMTALELHDKMMGSLVIEKNGKVIYDHTMGFYKTDGATTSPSNALTEFHIGSISKMFTAVLIMQLIEQHKLSLSTPLSDFFPTVPSSKQITIAQMLNHHSGIYDFTRDSTYPLWETVKKSQNEMVGVIAGGPPTFAPGAKGEYSNSNFVLLGYIVEKLNGKPYQDALSAGILKKIDLRHTYYGGKIDPKKFEAASFDFEDGKWKRADETDPSIPGGAGAIVSTPADLARFVEAIFRGRLISDSSLKLMKTMTDHMGMGMFEMPFGTHRGFGHSGHIDGFIGAVEYFPSDSTTIALLTNGLDHDMNGILIGILSIYYGMPYKIPTFKTVNVSDAELSSYEGTYSTGSFPMKFLVKKEGAMISCQATGQSAFPLDPIGNGKFQFEAAGIEIDFNHDASGKVTGLTIIQGSSTTFTKD